MNHSQYAELIAQIKRKRRWITGLTLAAILLIVILTSPIEIIIMNQPILLWGGCSPWVTAVLIILCLGIEVIAIGMVSVPLHTSMDEECDPEKHLILNMALNSNKNMDPIYAIDYLYLGDFRQAMVYAQKMSASKQDTMALAGFFNHAWVVVTLLNLILHKEHIIGLSDVTHVPVLEVKTIATNLLYAIWQCGVEATEQCVHGIQRNLPDA